MTKVESKSFNCTFMELKLQPAPFFFVKLIVLIVPLWN